MSCLLFAINIYDKPRKENRVCQTNFRMKYLLLIYPYIIYLSVSSFLRVYIKMCNLLCFAHLRSMFLEFRLWNEQTGSLHACAIFERLSFPLRSELLNYPSRSGVRRSAEWNSSSVGFSCVLRSRVSVYVVSPAGLAILRSRERTEKFKKKNREKPRGGPLAKFIHHTGTKVSDPQ